jgi:hypothetical protein
MSLMKTSIGRGQHKLEPPMRVRYRKLSRRFDTEGYKSNVKAAAAQAREKAEAELVRFENRSPLQKVVDSVLSENDPPSPGQDALVAGAGEAIVGLVSNPQLIDTQEGEGELEEVRELVKNQTLGPDDLVDLGDGWTTVSACVPLLEAVEHAEAQPKLDPIAIAVLLVGVLALALWALS